MRPVPEPREGLRNSSFAQAHSVACDEYIALLRSALREPGTSQGIFFAPKEKNKGRGPHFYFCTSCLYCFEILSRTEGVFYERYGID